MSDSVAISSKPVSANGIPGAPVENINILVIGTDLSFARSVQGAFQTVAAENADKNYRVFPGGSMEKIIEALEKHVFHTILVESEFIPDVPLGQWIKTFREILKKKPQNAEVPVAVVVSETDVLKTRQLVREGWKDVILKPLDNALFLQKLSLYNPKSPLLKEELLFNLEGNKDIEVAFHFVARSISEYGIKISSAREIAPGSVVGISTPFIGVPLSAVALECTKVNDGFNIQFMFIGVTPSETQAIRKHIRQEYAEEKQAS